MYRRGEKNDNDDDIGLESYQFVGSEDQVIGFKDQYFDRELSARRISGSGPESRFIRM